MPLRLEALAKARPTEQFFRTPLDSGHMEYLHVEAAPPSRNPA